MSGMSENFDMLDALLMTDKLVEDSSFASENFHLFPRVASLPGPWCRMPVDRCTGRQMRFGDTVERVCASDCATQLICTISGVILPTALVVELCVCESNRVGKQDGHK
jgi:hypothetical protein